MTEASLFGSLISLREALEGTLPDWLGTLVGVDDAELLDHVFVLDLVTADSADGAIHIATIAVDREIRLDIPGVDAFHFYIGSSIEGFLFFEARLTLTPEFKLELSGVQLGLRFAGDVLKPYDPAETSVELHTTADILIDADLNLELVLPDGLNLEKCFLGETGIAVELSSFFVDLSRVSTANERLTEAGYDDDFVGVYAEQAVLEMPQDLADAFPETIVMENVIIGSTGFSGSVQLDWDPAESGEIGGMAFSLKGFELTFDQSALTAGSLEGTLTLPYFDQPLEIAVGLGEGGEIFARLSGAPGSAVLSRPGVFELSLMGIGFEAAEDGWWVLLSGTLLLEVGAPELTWPEIEVEELRIGPDGTVELPGGWLDLQQPLAMDLYGFRLEISRVGFGNEDDGRRWVGFSGGLHLVDLLPAGASVEGLRVIWDPAGGTDPQLTLQGVGLELTTPGVMYLNGDVALIDSDSERFFSGSLLLDLLPLGITMDAAVKVGHNSALDFNYAYLYLSLELPVGVPLWATGAGLYGLSGLYGLNVAPTASEGDWYGWYKADPAFNIIDDSKWSGELQASAFGAGLVLGTLFDGGWVVNAKGLLAVVMPGPVLMLHSQANLMKLPPGLLAASEEGTFNALAVLDGNAGDLALAIDAGWELKKVVDIAASAEAYFDFSNPANWHLYLGQESPEDRRIRAWVITLFNADAYLMIEPAGIAAGFGVTWGESWKFGPVKVTLKAWIEAGAALTWSPPQLEGSLSLGGEFSVKVALFSVGIAAEATLSAKTPKLYRVRGELEITVKLPAPVKDLEETVMLEWKQDEPPPLEDPFTGIALEHLKVTETWPAVSGNSGRDPDHPAYSPGPLVPLDARPVVTFDRSVEDNSGLNNIDGSAYAGPDDTGDYEFEYEVTDIMLEYWPKAGAVNWKALPDDELFGAWAAMADGDGEVAASKLQLWTKTPFSFTRQTSRAYRDWFLNHFPDWPCTDPEAAQEICVDWTDETIGTELGEVFNHQGLAFDADTSAEVVGASGAAPCSVDAQPAVHFHYNMWVLFPNEPAHDVDICIEGKLNWIRTYAEGELVHTVKDPKDQVVRLRGAGIEWVHLDGPEEGAVLVSICYKTDSQVASEAWSTDRMDRLEAGKIHWESEEPILAPETFYRLSVQVKTTRKGKGATETLEEEHVRYFHTTAPPALDPALLPPANNADLGVRAYPEGDRWKDIGIYTDRLIPADGSVAVYRAYGLGAEFNEDYVEQMYGADMVIRLLDANGRPILDENGEELFFRNEWEDMPAAELTETEYPYVERVSACLPDWDADYPPNQRITAGRGVLLVDDFSQGLDNWIDPADADGDPAGNWAISGGKLTLVNALGGALGNMLVAGDPGWGDYALEVGLSDHGDEVGLVFRYDDSGGEAYYRLRMNASGRWLDRIQDGIVTALWEDDEAYTPGGADTLAVQCTGARIRGQLDDRLLFDHEDAEPLLTGQVGLYALASTSFERFLVREWPGAALAPSTLYTAELLASYVRFQSVEWPADPTGDGWLEMVDVNKRFVLHGQESWDDYRVEATFTVGTDDRAGLVARFTLDGASGEFSCYRLFFNPEDRKLRLAHLTGTFDAETLAFTIDTRDPFWECLDPACGIDFDLTEHDAALTCEGSRLTIEVDGRVIDTVADQRLSSGRFGLYFSGTGDPAFSDFVIRSRPRRPVHRWTFSSSAHTGLVEHLDTFKGGVFPEETGAVYPSFQETRVAALDEIGVAQAALEDARSALESAGPESIRAGREAAIAAVDELNRVSGRHFDELSALFFPGVYRPLPPVVELSEVRVGGDRHALLLESPEPLDWVRFSVLARRLRAAGWKDVARPYSAIWSADGTRAYLMLSDGDVIGDHTLEIQLARALETAEGPTLRRAGSTLPDVARLRFTLQAPE